MGIGIGAEYPLSAVITSEWSSTSSRASMLSSVFLMQPVGQALAQIVGIWVLLGRDDQYNLQAMQCGINTKYEEECRKIIDGIWRIVIGSGCVPAVLAIIFRFFLYDSGLYNLEVKRKPGTAFRDTQRVYGAPPPASSQESPYSPGASQRETFQFMPVQYSKANLYNYFIKDGNWHYLLGKSSYCRTDFSTTLTTLRHCGKFIVLGNKIYTIFRHHRLTNHYNRQRGSFWISASMVSLSIGEQHSQTYGQSILNLL